MVFLGYELQVPGDHVWLILLAHSCTVVPHTLLPLKHPLILKSETYLFVHSSQEQKRKLHLYSNVPIPLKAQMLRNLPLLHHKIFPYANYGRSIIQIIHTEMEQSIWRIIKKSTMDVTTKI